MRTHQHEVLYKLIVVDRENLFRYPISFQNTLFYKRNIVFFGGWGGNKIFGFSYLSAVRIFLSYDAVTDGLLLLPDYNG